MLLATAVVGAVFLTVGCGSGSGNGSGDSADAAVAAPSVGTSSSAQASAFPTADHADVGDEGVLLALCGGGGGGASAELVLVDPETGSVLARRPDRARTADMPYTPLATAVCPASQYWAPTKRLSPDLSIVVASRTQTDRSVHAGYIDVVTGQFHDVAAPVHEAGFTATVTEDVPIGFTADGTLLFRAKVPGSQPYSEVDKYWRAEAPDFVPEVTDSLAAKTLASPSGDQAVWAYAGSAALSLPPGTPPRPDLIDTEASHMPAGFAAIRVDGPAASPSQVTCEDPLWLTDAELLCTREIIPTIMKLSNKQLVNSGCPGCYQWVVPGADVRPLLPANERSNSGFTPSPDGSSVAFFSSEGEDRGLYVVESAAGSQPRELTVSGISVEGARIFRWT